MTHLAAPTVMPPVPGLPYAPDEALLRPLSQMLRSDTELAHKDVERRLGLPGSIGNVEDYRQWLLRFYQLYRPLESQFERFPDWIAIGLQPPSRPLSTRLAADLKALAVEASRDAPDNTLPLLPDFAHALGACYVMEGSALGSQFMLPLLHETLGSQMTGADSFFRGRGLGTGAFWKEFRAALDLYGDTHPAQTASVVAGALATFEAIGLWMERASSQPARNGRRQP